ncbi:uncharacterized protein LOC135833941 [Planococcus citri]|uniref:uncharacterized protein LOC135833941 n=1 Tax=Planococcus citri TaxID=170843 RepID=UPI0031FA38B5
MKLIAFAFILINCVYGITSAKLPLNTNLKNANTDDVVIDNFNTESLNTRDIDPNYGYGSYVPADYGNLSFVSNWVDNISRMLQPDTSYYNPPAYYPYPTDYNQGQWSAQPWSYDWSQYTTNSHPNQNFYQNAVDVSHQVPGTYNPNYYADQYQYQQPGLTKKISTVFNTGDSQEIKHKLIISPEYPDGTGYISVKPSGGNNISGSSSKDGKVYYRF